VTAYRWLLGLLALALATAFLVWAIGDDPGYVLLQRGEWALETSLVFAVVAAIAVGIAAYGAIWLLRWPLVAMGVRARRRNRLQFQRGTLALAEGRPQRAENLLLAASRLASLKLPALLAAYRAAEQRGDLAKRDELGERIAAHAEGHAVAAVLRADAALAEGAPERALELLAPLDAAQKLPPSGVKLLVDALVARGRARDARAHLTRLRRSHTLSAAGYERLESRVIAAALAESASAAELTAQWEDLSRSQRRDAVIASAYARRAGPLGLGELAARELEAVLRKAWSDELAEAWAGLPGEPGSKRLRSAEGFLKDHPQSARLMLAIGRLCREQSLWGKTEELLRRALAAGAGAAAWEELGHAYAAQGDSERASRAYANALAVARGEPAAPLTARGAREDVQAPLAIAEERDQHGVPRLPGGGR
jgi:HemY protein